MRGSSPNNKECDCENISSAQQIFRDRPRFRTICWSDESVWCREMCWCHTWSGGNISSNQQKNSLTRWSVSCHASSRENISSAQPNIQWLPDLHWNCSKQMLFSKLLIWRLFVRTRSKLRTNWWERKTFLPADKWFLIWSSERTKIRWLPNLHWNCAEILILLSVLLPRWKISIQLAVGNQG